MKEKSSTFYKQTTPFALLMGGCFISASYIAFRANGNIFNNVVLNQSIAFLYIIGLFIQVRRYRESPESGGYISYKKAFTTGLWTVCVSSLVYSIYSCILYNTHPELIERYLFLTEEMLRKVYQDSTVSENMFKLLKAFTTPVTLGFSELFSKIVNGVIYSLIIAFVLKKKDS